MRNLFLGLTSLLPLLGFAAADSTIHNLPTRSTPSGADYLVVDYTSGLAWYNAKVSVYSLRDFMSGMTYPNSTIYTTNAQILFLTNSVTVTTNLYATNSYIAWLTNNVLVSTNLYATNVNVLWQTNGFLLTTNLFATNSYIAWLTNNVLMSTNLYVTNGYIEYLTNNYLVTTNLFTTNGYIEYLTNNYLITTNLFVTNAYIQWLTNDTILATNIIAVKNLTVNSNITYLASTPFTNAWAGPSNVIPLHIADLNYITFTPCEIQGVTSKSNTVAQHSLLTMMNSSGSNITITLNAAIRSGDYARNYTLSNNAVGVFSVGYTPALGGLTNLVYRDFN